MAIDPNFVAALGKIVGPDALLSAASDCLPYGRDNSDARAAPEAVVFPQQHAQIVEIVRLCNRYQTPLTARGRGTATTGAAVPLQGGLLLSLERMRAILRVDPDNRLLIAQPGAANGEVQRAAGQAGFFWAPDPSSGAFCSIGGNIGCNAGGPRTVKYGATRENVLGLRGVAGDGEPFRCGGLTTKSAVGYDLTRLLIGAEGTLAIITEATLKLTPLPAARRCLRALYRDIHAAAAAVARIMAQPVSPCALEFMDDHCVALIRADLGLPAAAGALLLIEVDGQEECIDAATDAVAAAASGEGVSGGGGLVELRAARDAAESDALWATRRALSPRLQEIAPKKINEDIVVPVARIPELIAGMERLAARYAIAVANFGHAGNGNIHVNLLLDADDAETMARAERCLEALFDLTLELEGTISGEHGIGVTKRRFLPRAIDPVALRLMGAIRRQFDPNGILNPGKGPAEALIQT